MGEKEWVVRRQSLASDLGDVAGPELLALDDLIVLAQTLLLNLPRRFDPWRLLVRLLWIRLLETSEATSILCRHRLELDAEVVERSAFEALVYLLAIAKDPKIGESYLALAGPSALGLAQAALNSREPVLQEDRQTWESVVEELKEDLRKAQVKSLPSIQALARNVGLGEYYEVVYRSGSLAVHIRPQALIRHAIIRDGGLAGLQVVPPTPEAAPARLLYLAADFLLRGTWALLEAHGIDSHGGLLAAKETLERIGQEKFKI